MVGLQHARVSSRVEYSAGTPLLSKLGPLTMSGGGDSDDGGDGDDGDDGDDDRHGCIQRRSIYYPDSHLR